MFLPVFVIIKSWLVYVLLTEKEVRVLGVLKLMYKQMSTYFTLCFQVCYQIIVFIFKVKRKKV